MTYTILCFFGMGWVEVRGWGALGRGGGGEGVEERATTVGGVL